MTAFVLKLIASACMLIDHIGAVFPASTPLAFRFIGRIAFPVYAYLVAQGCKHTKNINKYLLRLGVFALISEIPFDLAFYGRFNWTTGFLRDTNVFYTLFLGVGCIAVYEKLKQKAHPWLALSLLPVLASEAVPLLLPEAVQYRLPLVGFAVFAALCAVVVFVMAQLLPDAEAPATPSPGKKAIAAVAALPLVTTAGAIYTDYASIGVILIFALYLAKPENCVTRTLTLAAGVIYLYGQNLFSIYGDFINGQFTKVSRALNAFNPAYLLCALVAVVLVFLYNGKPGRKIKWAFYAFYPVHIAVLAGIRFLL